MKKVIEIFTLLIFLTIITYKAEARNSGNYFKHITIENGLSQNTVLSILQDKNGFMWFGTKDGLNRYDGNSIKVFKKNNLPFSLGNNTIWSLMESRDRTIWIGTDRGIYIYNPANETFQLFDLTSDSGQKIEVPILDIKMDKKGNIWIAADRLYCYSPQKNKLYDMYTQHDIEVLYPRCWSIYIDDDNQVWVCMHGLGIRKYKSTNKAQHEDFLKTTNGNAISKTLFSRLMSYENNYLIAGTINGGVRFINKITAETTPFFPDQKEFSDLFVRDLAFIDKDLWIGTESGLYIMNPETKKTEHFSQNINDKFSLSDNAIYSMYKDREGGIWIGTYFGGVNYISKQNSYFEKYYPVSGRNAIRGERISGICEDNQGNIWIGTEDAGLNKFDPKTKVFEHFAPGSGKNGISYNNVHDVILDNNQLWVGLFNSGIYVLDLATKQTKHYQKSNAPYSLDNNDIFALHKDKAGNIWVGTSSGAFLFDKTNNHFTKQTQIGQHFFSDILEDNKGRIWFATYDAGVFSYNPRTKKYLHYPFNNSNPKSICSYKIISIFEDSKNRIWFTGETGGICSFNESTRDFTQYGLKDGFVSDVIYKILEDKKGNFWLSSNSGLMKFNPETKKVRIFYTGNGLLCNQFNYKSGYRDKKGKMYFGGINGLIAFNPESFVTNKYIPPVFITKIKLLDRKNSFSKELADESKDITLKHNQSSFSIDFSALSFTAPELNRYAYKMVGLENNWVYLDKAQTIIYSNLPYGTYQFQVKASNNDGVWNEKGDYINITILPPFWKSKFAYLLYAIILLFSVYYILNSNYKRLKRKSENERILFEKEKEKEMYNAKINFFTNIAHEIRTPLTLIKSPLEHILTNKTDEKELNSNLQVMDKNTDRLLLLINQLLDFRKIESKTFSLSFVKTDIVQVINETYIRFKPLAINKGMEFQLEVPSEKVLADVDKEALIKILSNFFSNAIKYGKSQITASLTQSDTNFFIRVNNDGKIIPNELKEQIFEPFFQIKEHHHDASKTGSGIGLALARSLADLHKGSVILDKTLLGLNSFLLSIPLTQENSIVLSDNLDTAEVAESVVTMSQESNKEQLLIVEDDEELLSFMVDKLAKKYAVHFARNGKEAIKVLEKEIINIVISDIMMPEMDGLELCQKMKDDINYSHIPVILLTAKTTIQNKIEGLDSGADAYIEKPFSLDFLYAQISNLLNNRRKIKETFANSPYVQTGSIALSKSDETFLNSMNAIILKNISDPGFHVEHLAKALCMSRSSLLRKIKGLSEFSPNDFIKIIRLKKAAEILQEGEYKINEVCFLVGFSSTSYFTKAFQKQFGILPKDFAKTNKKTQNRG